MRRAIKTAAARIASLGMVAGKLAWRAYCCHLLVFAAGAICGAVEAFLILTAMYGVVPQ